MSAGRGRLRIPEAAPAGLLAAALSLVLVLTAYVQLYEATSEAAALEEELTAIQTQQEALQAAYAAPDVLLQEAGRLGLVQPEAWQLRTVTLPLRDHAQLLVQPEQSPVESLRANLCAAAAEILAYFP